MSQEAKELETIYSQRFEGRQEYRNRVWQVLIQNFFRKFLPDHAAILDLGCGYGEFINQVQCRSKYGMDLNPTTKRLLGADVQFLQQDCSAPWPLPENTLDVVFTSNFFEHLPNKQTLGSTLEQAHRCLKPGGRIIAMGPNIKYVPGAYWDFWDHYLALTELSLSEGMKNRGFDIDVCCPRFLPYTMVNAPQYPLVFLRAYLALPMVWPMFGKQFLVIGVCRKEKAEPIPAVR
jgi:SAM-dependent methyltransferase